MKLVAIGRPPWRGREQFWIHRFSAGRERSSHTTPSGAVKKPGGLPRVRAHNSERRYRAQSASDGPRAQRFRAHRGLYRSARRFGGDAVPERVAVACPWPVACALGSVSHVVNCVCRRKIEGAPGGSPFFYSPSRLRLGLGGGRSLFRYGFFLKSASNWSRVPCPWALDRLTKSTDVRGSK